MNGPTGIASSEWTLTLPTSPVPLDSPDELGACCAVNIGANRALAQKKTTMRLLRIAVLPAFEYDILFIRPIDNLRINVTTNAVNIKLSPLSK